MVAVLQAGKRKITNFCFIISRSEKARKVFAIEPD